MSQRNVERKQSARERLMAQRLAAQRRGRRRRQYAVIAAVVVLLGVATGVGIAVSSSSSKPRAYSVPSDGSVVADKYADPSGKPTALAYGPADAPHTLTI